MEDNTIDFENMPEIDEPKFKTGDRVLITEGPYKGKIGTIKAGPYLPSSKN